MSEYTEDYKRFVAEERARRRGLVVRIGREGGEVISEPSQAEGANVVSKEDKPDKPSSFKGGKEEMIKNYIWKRDTGGSGVA